jgi:hypothetical protein
LRTDRQFFTLSRENVLKREWPWLREWELKLKIFFLISGTRRRFPINFSKVSPSLCTFELHEYTSITLHYLTQKSLLHSFIWRKKNVSKKVTMRSITPAECLIISTNWYSWMFQQQVLTKKLYGIIIVVEIFSSHFFLSFCTLCMSAQLLTESLLRFKCVYSRESNYKKKGFACWCARSVKCKKAYLFEF